MSDFSLKNLHDGKTFVNYTRFEWVVEVGVVTIFMLRLFVPHEFDMFSPHILPFSSLESSKTDQFRDGAWIVIARSDLPTCPVKALKEYVSAAQIDLSEELPLFRALISPWSKVMVRSQGISYLRARELVKDAFRGLTDVSKLSVHSLRAGGAMHLSS